MNLGIRQSKSFFVEVKLDAILLLVYYSHFMKLAASVAIEVEMSFLQAPGRDEAGDVLSSMPWRSAWSAACVAMLCLYHSSSTNESCERRTRFESRGEAGSHSAVVATLSRRSSPPNRSRPSISPILPAQIKLRLSPFHHLNSLSELKNESFHF